VLKDDGRIYQTNYLTTKSYHAGSYAADGDENLWSVGIALQGDFTDDPPPQEQLDAARALVAHLKELLDIGDVLKHKEMPGASTQCPGNTSDDWIGYVRGE
jgi:N-acetyl-anhydromuramyl-L-alanine amidase AmpD